MRTTKSTVTFHDRFILNRDVGELPAGSYDIEVDEEEILTMDRTGYRRVAAYFYVQAAGSMRTLIIDPVDLESALERDRTTSGQPGATGTPKAARPATLAPDGAFP